MKPVKRKLLIVDDVQINRMTLSELFKERYEVLEAANGKEAVRLIELYWEDISVVLLDLIMPEMDGFEVLELMNQAGVSQSIPFIIITGESDFEKTLKIYELGVADIISKPFHSDIVYRRVNNVVSLYVHQHNLEEKLREQKEMLEQQGRRLRQTNRFVIDALSTAVEFRDRESGEHIHRVRTLVRLILENIRGDYPLSDEEIDTISNVSVMHDIGKIAIPDSILLKPGPLTPEEFEVMKTHTIRGCEMLSSLNYMSDSDYFNYGYEICRHHHERWDGRGYPDGLRGDEISIWAQATALADVYDALTSERVYKGAYTAAKALNMILGGECGAFNPKMLACLERLGDTLVAGFAPAVG